VINDTQGNRIASTSTHSDPTTGNPVTDATTYFLTDTVGLTRVALSADGTVLSQGDFAPFGTLLRDRTSHTAPGIASAAAISFTGEVHDDETGLDTYKYRSYNPKLGRWMSPDPSGEHYANLGSPQSLNLYSYVLNDPLKYIDKLGLCASSCNGGGDNCDASCEGGGDGSGDGGDGGDGGGGDGGGSGGGDGSGGGGGGGADGGGCPVDACVTADPEPPVEPDPGVYSWTDPLNFTPTGSTQQTVQFEQAAEKQARANIAKYAANNAPLHPGDSAANMRLTPSCDKTNSSCTYTLTGMGTNVNPITGVTQNNTYFVWEHQTEDVNSSQPVGTEDYITPISSVVRATTDANSFNDTLGGSSLDTYRFFTISTSATYNSSNQTPIMINELGTTVAYEHIYSTGGPVYINGSSSGLN
jgi:RHS repeat-associated protein